MQDPKTIKVVDKDCPGGFRIINEADKQKGDELFKEPEPKKEGGKAGDKKGDDKDGGAAYTGNGGSGSNQ